MAETLGRRSVWQSRDGFVAHLNWRSWRTWVVLPGLWAIFGPFGTSILLLVAAVAERMIEDHVAASITGAVTGFAFSAFTYLALKRALPLRDETGAAVPGNPRFDFAMLPEAAALAFLWFLGYVPFLVWAMVQARALGIFSEGLPFWLAPAVVPLFMATFEVTFRIVWRAPRQTGEGPGHG